MPGRMGIADYQSRFTKGLALEHVYHWERTQPDAPWLTQPMGGGVLAELTWKQAVGEARRIAAYLRSLELPAASSIGLISKSTAHWILADLAIWMAGHVTVPMYSTSSPGMVKQILEHSEAKLVMIGKLDAFDAIADAIPPSMPRLTLPLGPASIDAPAWAELVAATAPIADDPVREPDELATIVYTSGSTGTPKGVMHTHGAIARTCIGIGEVYPGIGPGDRLLSHLPMAHVAERLVCGVGSMFAGLHVYFCDSLATFAADLQRARPTLFFTVPRLWQKFQLAVNERIPPKRLSFLLKVPLLSRVIRKKLLKAMGLDAVSMAAVGSAPMPTSLLAWYKALGLEVLDGYGMTENFGYSHGTRLGRVRAGWCGEPQPGVEHRIGDGGEILVKSPGSMIGYFKEPEMTASAFTEDGFLRTGDRGEIDDHGRLRITGRVKELFKTSKGKYIAPVPIENELASLPGIEAVCVSGAGRAQPFALVMLGADVAGKTPRPELEANIGGHITAINQSLESHERLQFVVVVKDPWLPDNGLLTPTLKIKRGEIERRYEPAFDAWYADGRPVLFE